METALMFQPVLRPQTEEEYLEDSFNPMWIGTWYTFHLLPEFYNSLPIKVKRFLYRSGNYLHIFATNRPVEIRLSQNDFYHFNEMLWTQIGHA